MLTSQSWHSAHAWSALAARFWPRHPKPWSDGRLVCCPQTRMMAQKKSPFPDQYSGFLDCLLKVPRQEGFLALYKVTEPTFLILNTCLWLRCVHYVILWILLLVLLLRAS